MARPEMLYAAGPFLLGPNPLSPVAGPITVVVGPSRAIQATFTCTLLFLTAGDNVTYGLALDGSYNPNPPNFTYAPTSGVDPVAGYAVSVSCTFLWTNLVAGATHTVDILFSTTDAGQDKVYRASLVVTSD